jgi:hypothetical protein
MIGIQNKGIILGKSPFFSFKAFMDSENFVITAPKVGSRFLLQVFEKNEVDFKLPTHIHSISDLKVTSSQVITTGDYKLHYDVELYEQSLKNEWNKIIDGKSTKTLVFLYRHPIERFKSAIIQDFAGSITEGRYDNFFYIKELLLNKGFSEENAMMFISQFGPILSNNTGMTIRQDNSYQQLYMQVEDAFKYLLKVYTSHAVKNGTHHYNDYLSVFDTLDRLGIVKYGICINLDTKYFKSYFEKRANVPQIHSNLKNGKDLIENLVSDNAFIREGLHKYLKEDLVIYSILNSKIDGL